MVGQKEVLLSFLDFFVKPFTSKDMFWILIPLMFSLVIMEIYYIKYKDEVLGWNTATANSLILIFIGMDLLRYLTNEKLLSFLPSSGNFTITLLVSLVMLEGILMFSLNFTHKWPKFIAFHFSSRATVNLIAYVSIIIVYGSLPITGSTFIAAFLFFLLVILFFFLIRIIHISKKKHKQVS